MEQQRIWPLAAGGKIVWLADYRRDVGGRPRRSTAFAPAVCGQATGAAKLD
jgi:hypothetical protein